MSSFTSFRVAFNIDGDDKEHQDAVCVRISDPNGNQLLYNEVCPPMPGDGDNNEYYWPSDGPGVHEHSYVVTPPSPIPFDTLMGYKFDIVSGYTSGHGDFKSWNSFVNVEGNLDNGTSSPILFLKGDGSRNASAYIDFIDDDHPQGHNQTRNFTIYSS
jgi:hypothetical protein